MYCNSLEARQVTNAFEQLPDPDKTNVFEQLLDA